MLLNPTVINCIKKGVKQQMLVNKFIKLIKNIS